MILFKLVEFLATFVEAIAGIWFNAKMLGNRQLKAKSSIILSFLLTLFAWIVNLHQIFSMSATLIGFFGIAIGFHIIYKSKLSDAIVLSAMYFLLVYIVDFLTISILGILFQEDKFATLVAEEFSKTRIVFLFISKFLLAVLIYVIADIFFQNVKIPVKKMWISIILCIALTGYLIHDTFMQTTLNTFLIWLLFLLFIITAIYSIVQYQSNLNNKLQMKIINEQNVLFGKNHTRIMQEYQKNQIFYHDLKNQYLVLHSLLENKEYHKAQEYMNLLNIAHRKTPKNWTYSFALNVLLDYKKQVANANNIQMEILSDSIDLKLPESEAIALLGNAIDNAIEACLKIKSHDRWIKISMQKVNTMSFIKVANSSNEIPKQKGDTFFSSKKGHNVPGLGLISMRAIVKKYDGDIKIEYTQDTFSITFSFFN